MNLNLCIVLLVATVLVYSGVEDDTVVQTWSVEPGPVEDEEAVVATAISELGMMESLFLLRSSSSWPFMLLTVVEIEGNSPFGPFYFRYLEYGPLRYDGTTRVRSYQELLPLLLDALSE